MNFHLAGDFEFVRKELNLVQGGGVVECKCDVLGVWAVSVVVVVVSKVEGRSVRWGRQWVAKMNHPTYLGVHQPRLSCV